MTNIAQQSDYSKVISNFAKFTKNLDEHIPKFPEGGYQTNRNVIAHK
jgi:hypothetical protein